MTELNADQRAAARLARIEAQQTEPEKFIYEHRREDYLYDREQNLFWCRRSRSLITPDAVNNSIPQEHWRRGPDVGNRPGRLIKPSSEIASIMNGMLVQGSTWAPGYPQVIEDKLAGLNGLEHVEGWRCFNTFLPGPVANHALADQAGPWIEHVKYLFPEPIEHGYFFDYCAHMVQKPQEKCNAAIVISGRQGIGKDAALYPLREAVGSWNTRNIGPDALLSRFNPWVETLMLTVDEVRPTNDDHKATAMYDSLKTLITTPPEVLPMENKNAKLRYIMNRMRIFLTTNDRLAMYIPPEDRRLMVLHSELQQGWQNKVDPQYFNKLFGWLENGGMAAVAGWLASRDLAAFNPKGEVPKTGTWAEISQRWDAPEDELTQALDMMGEPDCVLGSELNEQLFDGVDELRRMMKSRRFIHRMSQAGYKAVPVPEGSTEWVRKHEGYRVKTSKIYVKESLGLSTAEAQRIAANRLKMRAEAGPAGIKPPTQAHLKVAK